MVIFSTTCKYGVRYISKTCTSSMLAVFIERVNMGTWNKGLIFFASDSLETDFCSVEESNLF